MGVTHVSIQASSECAGSQIQRGDLIDFGAQFRRILKDGDGVQVHDTENALVVVLDADPVF